MLAAQYRFHGYSALKFLFGHGKTYRFKSLSVRVAQNTRREHSRATVVVSKKVFKAAPKRNRVRRRVYEALRTNWQHILPRHDILISIYDTSWLDCSAEELQAELRHALQTAHLWRD
jgi:ribonuclease P protein component